MDCGNRCYKYPSDSPHQVFLSMIALGRKSHSCPILLVPAVDCWLVKVFQVHL
jgi:hypothetical protein